MEIVIITLLAFPVAILTFFSGFGLGTIMTPVFMVFFPPELAIALTAVVHFFNNVFKLMLVGRHADRSVLLRFGVPAVLAALVGSWLLVHLSELPPLFTYSAFGSLVTVMPLKLIIAILLIIFALIDLIPRFGNLQFSRSWLPLGGAMSGFFGGLSGNQGALRSAFLIKAGLSKEAFVGTAVVVSSFVDFTRLSVYSTCMENSGLTENWSLVLCATMSGILGAYVGNRLLKKVSLRLIRTLTAIMLLLLSAALGAGLI